MPDTQEELLTHLARRDWAAPFDYDGLQLRIARRQRRSELGRRVAMASLTAVSLGLVGLLLVSGRSGPGAPFLSPATAPAAVAMDASTVQVAMDERWLSSLPREPAVARIATRLPVAQLEDRIAWLDDSLSIAMQERAAQSDIGVLRSQRAQLVDALVRVRYAEQLSTQFN